MSDLWKHRRRKPKKAYEGVSRVKSKKNKFIHVKSRIEMEKKIKLQLTNILQRVRLIRTRIQKILGLIIGRFSLEGHGRIEIAINKAHTEKYLLPTMGKVQTKE